MEYKVTPNSYALLKAMRELCIKDPTRGIIQHILVVFDPEPSKGATPLFSEPMFCATNSYAMGVGTAHADLDDPWDVSQAFVHHFEKGRAMLNSAAVDQLVKLAPKNARERDYWLDNEVRLVVEQTSDQTVEAAWLKTARWQSPIGEQGEFPNVTRYWVRDIIPAEQWRLSIEQLGVLMKAAKHIDAQGVGFHGSNGDAKVKPQFFSLVNGPVRVVGLVMPLRMDGGWVS